MPTSRREYCRGLALAGAAGLAGCSNPGDPAPTAGTPTPTRYRSEAAGVTVVERPTDRGLRIELVADARGTVRQTHDAFAIEANGSVDGEPVTFRDDATAHAFHRGTPIDVMDEPRVFVGPRLDPTDGVVDAYVIGWIEDPEAAPTFRALVYVDEDFRREVDGEINLAWGLDFLGHHRPYEYEQVADGVYRDEIVDRDVTRFVEGQPAGPDVLVGNLTQDDVRYRNSDGKTFVFLR